MKLKQLYLMEIQEKAIHIDVRFKAQEMLCKYLLAAKRRTRNRGGWTAN